MYLDNNKTGTIRTANFKVHHPQLDPSVTMGKEFETNYVQRTPTTLDKSTEAPRTLSKSRQYPDAQKWAQAHNAELDQLDEQNAIQWLTRQEAQTITGKPIHMTMTYRYK